MRKGKKFLAMFAAVLLLIPTFVLPVKAAEPQKVPEFQNNPFGIVTTPQAKKELAGFLTWISDRPFASELFTHFLYGKGDKAYWEEEVPEQVKEEIFANQEFQKKLQYVLEKAYSNGSWKVVYVFGKDTPAYYDPDAFNEPPFEETNMEFNSHELEAVIGHINGRLVIGADYLGNNKFEVWTGLSDKYDFDFQNCFKEQSKFCIINDIAAIFQRVNLGHTFNLTIGFTRVYPWTPPAEAAPAQPSAAAVQPTQPSAPAAQPQPASQQSASSQFYARGNYDIGDYTGAMVQGKPHGYGTLKYKSQTKYEIGMPDGTWHKAVEYTGNWVNGIRCGQGTFTFANGVRYEGVWNTDGYYFKGYVKSGNYRQYIEQTASGDTITTVRSGAAERIG